MSFGRLGIAHFPVLHQQFSPNSARFSDSLSSQDDLTQDNKDVLVERLNDLIQRLSRDGASIEDKAVTNIHHMVDGIESLMRERPKEPKIDELDDEYEMSGTEKGGPWNAAVPPQNAKMGLPEHWRSPQKLSASEKVITTSTAAEIAREAETLASQLSQTIAELQVRREESDHIHDLLITRAERAAERILVLEYRIAEMEDDFSSNQSELKILRIQMQAIEAQCSQYIPLSRDKELAESISKWKFDWEEIDRKSKARWKKCRDSITHSDDTETTVNGP